MTGPARSPADRWSPQFPGHVCSLGYQLVDWIEHACCHGPGDLQGDPVVLDGEFRAFLVAAYRLDPVTGRRQVDAAVLSRPKGIPVERLIDETTDLVVSYLTGA